MESEPINLSAGFWGRSPVPECARVSDGGAESANAGESGT